MVSNIEGNRLYRCTSYLNIHLLLWERSPDRDYRVQEHSPTRCSIILRTYIASRKSVLHLPPDFCLYATDLVVFVLLKVVKFGEKTCEPRGSME